MSGQRPALVLFIDSLPHRYVGELPFLSSMQVGALKPGFGYSMNIKAQLFAGMTPDDLGQLCSWNPTGQPSSAMRMLSGLRGLDGNAFATRWIHRLGSRLVGKPLAWAPLHLLRYFDHHEINAYQREFPHPTILTTPGAVSLLYRDFPPGPERDRLLFAEATRRVNEAEGLYFVASADLDHVGHRFGPGSAEHRAKMHELDELAAELVQAFLAAHPGAPVAIMSDHGMASVNGSVDPSVEQHLGPMHPDRYLAAVDATMARFWVRDSSLRERVAEFAGSVKAARLIEGDERKKYGIADPIHGDFIVLLEEGLVFCPSFYFREPPAGMHGYHPDAPDQRAFFATLNVNDPSPTQVDRVYPFLRRLLEKL